MSVNIRSKACGAESSNMNVQPVDIGLISVLLLVNTSCPCLFLTLFCLSVSFCFSLFFPSHNFFPFTHSDCLLFRVKSNQISFIHIAQNGNQIASMGFANLYSEQLPLSLEEEETSGRATEEGSLFQDGQTSNRCCMCRKEQ